MPRLSADEPRRLFKPKEAFGDPNEAFEMDTEEINTVPVPDTHWLEEKMTAIFTVDGLAYDATLDNETLTFSKVEGQGKSNRGSKFKKKKAADDVNYISLKNVYGVTVKRTKNAKKSDTEGVGVCEGMIVYTYERSGNKFKENAIFFQHPSDGLCGKWVERIQKTIQGYGERPQNLFFILQPFAGKKNARSLYKMHCENIFKLNHVKVEYIELEHNEHVKQLFAHMNFEDYDCICVMGGDGTVNKVVHNVLNKVQELENREKRMGFTPAKCTLPIAILPVGTTNSIAHSVMGTEDVYTAMVHMIMGHKRTVDISAAFCQEEFHHWVFHSQYGFHGNVLKYKKRYKSVGPKAMEAAYIKSLTRAKLIPYEVEIKYLPADTGPEKDTSHPRDEVICKMGCKVCKDGKSESDSASVHVDEVMELDTLGDSGHSDTLVKMIDLSKEHRSKWKTVKGHYLSIGLYALPGRSEFAPAGCSKYAHLADGCADLVLVNGGDTSRKDFIRFIKRHGSASKNQLDLPFVEAFRVKEVLFHQRMATTWKHKDHSYSEIENEMKKQEKHKNKKRNSMVQIIDDLSVTDSFEDEVDEDSDSSLEIPTMDGDGWCDGKNALGSASSSANGSLAGSAKDINKNSKKDKNAELRPGVRLSFLEKEHLRRKEKREKKEKKLKEKDESKTKTVWNLDGEMERETDLHFVVYEKLLTVCGFGCYDDAEAGKSKMPMFVT
ncbi:ceramide kinase-like isoform X2 [Lineus longissimus]|uniref:ceramide kinase-like isoform X2 n=1 Tax=Lineus longissimus TaxID=88925 RepID=UPI00315C56B1